MKDWSDLWLSDGISAFVGDAFLGQRLGNEAYERQIEHSRQIYNQLRAQGNDRALSNDEWTAREEADDGIPLQKGVCFLYLVREMVGDDAFWEGLRLYTSEQWGHAATSEDFQKAFGTINTGNRSAAKQGEAARKSNTKKNSAKTLNDLFFTGSRISPLPRNHGNCNRLAPAFPAVFTRLGNSVISPTASPAGFPAWMASVEAQLGLLAGMLAWLLSATRSYHRNGGEVPPEPRRNSYRYLR